VRSLKSDFTMTLAAMEESGATAEAITKFIGRGRARKAQIEGNLQEGDACAGSSVGLIKEILPAASVIENLIRSYREITPPKL
jgi:enoyl-[acyl-carrier protein] reductase II